jgi:hypothetical protein
MSLNVLDIFSKNLKYKIPLKSVMWVPSYYRRMDRHDETNSLFCSFANALKKANIYWTLSPQIKEIKISLHPFFKPTED